MKVPKDHQSKKNPLFKVKERGERFVSRSCRLLFFVVVFLWISRFTITMWNGILTFVEFRSLLVNTGHFNSFEAILLD